jgi:hypothetical protein
VTAAIFFLRDREANSNLYSFCAHGRFKSECRLEFYMDSMIAAKHSF